MEEDYEKIYSSRNEFIGQYHRAIYENEKDSLIFFKRQIVSTSKKLIRLQSIFDEKFQKKRKSD